MEDVLIWLILKKNKILFLFYKTFHYQVKFSSISINMNESYLGNSS